MFRVVRKDDEEHNVYAAKKFHKNIKDCYQRERIAYHLLPKSDLLGECIESFDEGDKKYLILKMIHGKNLDQIIYRDSTKQSYNCFQLELIIKWLAQLARIVEMI